MLRVREEEADEGEGDDGDKEMEEDACSSLSADEHNDEPSLSADSDADCVCVCVCACVCACVRACARLESTLKKRDSTAIGEEGLKKAFGPPPAPVRPVAYTASVRHATGFCGHRRGRRNDTQPLPNEYILVQYSSILISHAV